MKNLSERFFERVKKTNNCWEWIGTKSRGYGCVISTGKRKGRKILRAHRVSWEIHYGPIKDGIIVCHRCDNPSCVNPKHLWLGTPVENNRDRDSKGRQKTPRGENHPMTKLTDSDVLRIRALHGRGIEQKKISKMFNVYPSTVSQIVHRIYWTHI